MGVMADVENCKKVWRGSEWMGCLVDNKGERDTTGVGKIELFSKDASFILYYTSLHTFHPPSLHLGGLWQRPCVPSQVRADQNRA